MIEINLLPGPRKKRARAGFTMPNFGEMLGKVKDPLLLGAVGAWVVAAAFVGLTYFARAREVSQAQDRLSNLEREQQRYNTLIAQKRRADSLRVRLEIELSTIRRIDADRYVWPHIMEEVTKALPDYTWLVNLEFTGRATTEEADSLAAPPVRFSIEGRTSDIEAYTRFVEQLSNSPWLTDIGVGGIQEVIEEDRPVKAFTVTGRYQEADMAYKRTVPLRESVR